MFNARNNLNISENDFDSKKNNLGEYFYDFNSYNIFF